MQGFDGKPFDYYAAPGVFRLLLSSVSQGFSLRAQYGARSPTVAVQRSLELKSGSNTVLVSITGSAASGWGLAVTANGGPVAASLPGGVKVTVNTFQPPVKRRQEASFARLTASQRWNDVKNTPLDFLNFGLTLLAPLQQPVAGVLGPSYTAAVRRTQTGAGGGRRGCCGGAA
ncbi:hypothetical protein ABPG75_004561 [Micractinium tetrahymenae]